MFYETALQDETVNILTCWSYTTFPAIISVILQSIKIDIFSQKFGKHPLNILTLPGNVTYIQLLQFLLLSVSLLDVKHIILILLSTAFCRLMF